MITKNSNDELGQLISKNVGGTDATGATGLQTVDYNYNIRGWLKNINDVNNIGNDLFAFKISYNDFQAIGTNDIQPEALFNGNISATYWKTKYGSLQKYNYSYDDLNRLNEAVYLKPELSINDINAYNETLSYDKNGNIQTLERNGGINAGLPNPIDELTYTYDTNNKNLLVKVADTSTSPQGFKNGSNTGNDYEYDANGNLTIDNNKGITKIVYNHLNLPTEITFAGTDKISYIYNATGQKVVKVVTENSTITKTHYLAGGFQYKNNVLQFFPQAEGYVKKEANSYNYVFNYTDHLGNIRLSYTDMDNNGTIDIDEIVEENEYYPFGLKHESHISSNAYQYKYNGAELQTELGLNMYDMEMRDYNPALGRWVNQDPVVHHSMSPYNAFDNNPVFWADPSGADAVYNWDTGKYMDGDKEVSFEQAMASHGINLGDSGNSETPEDDITVNKDGFITSIVRNGRPNKFFDQNGKEINFNDISEVDSDMNSYTFKIGERLFYNISKEELNLLIIKGGLEAKYYNAKFYLSFGLNYYKFMAFKYAAKNSHDETKADFTFSTLAKYSFTLSNARGGSYFTFGNKSTMYNLYDAGNFMWGLWMKFSLFDYQEARLGSQINEAFGDSEADQRAIKNAYKF